MHERFHVHEVAQLVNADYSQIELCAAAVIAKDEAMLAAYQSGEDIHARTAASILGKPINKVTEQNRQLAKAVNFGLLYGQSPRGLVRYTKSGFEVYLTDEEAVLVVLEALLRRTAGFSQVGAGKCGCHQRYYPALGLTKTPAIFISSGVFGYMAEE